MDKRIVNFDLSRKPALRKKLTFCLVLSILVLIIMVIMLKFGIDSWQARIDSHTWPEIVDKLPKILTIVSVSFILALFFFGFERENYYIICPKCLKVYQRFDVYEKKCPKCLVGVEPLKGFYERHPGLKSKKKRV